MRGLDVSGRRIALARRAAGRLGLDNVAYEEGDARDFKGDGEVAAAYMLDIVHHVPPATVPPLLPRPARQPAGRRAAPVKDVDTHPALKRWFTWALDRAMAPRTPVHYWRVDELARRSTDAGFAVHRHLMVDVLPYPHVLYVCEAR